MKGVAIFLHSLRQVTGNLPSAIKVSALPYAVQFLVTFFLTRPDKIAAMANDPAAMMAGGPSLIAQLLSFLVIFATSVWMAVAWHRFVLRNESPSSFVPPIDPDRMLGYFLRSLGVGVICFLLLIVFGFVAGLVGGAVAYATGSTFILLLVVAILVYFPVFVIAYRLMTALPAPAVADEAGPFMAGWDATKGQNETFIGLGVISALVIFANGFIVFNLVGASTVLFLAWTLAFNWFATMVGLSILTTLYGHYIEKRALT
ncbi:hypothetical protein MCELHM10_02636 [Paracoccaceae bacterium]